MIEKAMDNTKSEHTAENTSPEESQQYPGQFSGKPPNSKSKKMKSLDNDDSLAERIPHSTLPIDAGEKNTRGSDESNANEMPDAYSLPLNHLGKPLNAEQYVAYMQRVGLDLDDLPANLRPAGHIDDNRMPPNLGDDVQEAICYESPKDLQLLLKHYIGDQENADRLETIQNKRLLFFLNHATRYYH